MADDDSSELSSLSSLSDVPDDEINPFEEHDELDHEEGILKYFGKLPKGAKNETTKEPSSPAPVRTRAPSPPHEYVLGDNPDIAFIVMFRSRFNDAFPKSLANFGPQELERDVSEPVPGTRVEQFLCALLGLLLNRKQDVKPGHYSRALEDAIATHKNQWPEAWEEKSPVSGSSTFTSMTPVERLTLLRTLVLWTLSSSDVVKAIINQSYKGSRREDDLNQPLSVQPWGSDSDKRRYFLIEGLDDTSFRVYRESNPAGFNRTWWSVAGTIDELNTLVDKLTSVDSGPKARKLAQQMVSAIPRFEAGEEKRRRREYRQMQKERFKRPEPGFSLYEGRTRGKRIKYTYSDDEDWLTDSTGPRRSSRNTGTHTPAEGPVTTASGRQVRAPSRLTVDQSNNIVSTSPDQDLEQRATSKESSLGPTGRPRRSAAVNHGLNGWTSSRNRGYNSMDDEYDSEASEPELGDDEEEYDQGADEVDEDEDEFDEDEEMVDDDLDDSPKSMVVKLKMPQKEGLKLDFDKFRYQPDTNPPPASDLPPERKETPTELSISVPSKGQADLGSMPSAKSIEHQRVSEQATPIITTQSSPEAEIKVAFGPATANHHPQKEEDAEPSIEMVPRKQATPEAENREVFAAHAVPLQPGRSPLTPSYNPLQSNSLAFRESPEKPHQVQPIKPLDPGTT